MNIEQLSMMLKWFLKSRPEISLGQGMVHFGLGDQKVGYSFELTLNGEESGVTFYVDKNSKNDLDYLQAFEEALEQVK